MFEMISLKQKKRSSSAEDERSWLTFNSRVPRCISHLFGNPAIPNIRIRGFASPDCSGFALSEILPKSVLTSATALQ